MPILVQVVLLVVGLVVCVVSSLIIRRKCQRWGYDRRQTNATVTATATGLLFILLYTWPDLFPALGIPTGLGLALIILDLAAFVVATVRTVWLDRRKEIAAFIEDITPPES